MKVSQILLVYTCCSTNLFMRVTPSALQRRQPILGAEVALEKVFNGITKGKLKSSSKIFYEKNARNWLMKTAQEKDAIVEKQVKRINEILKSPLTKPWISGFAVNPRLYIKAQEALDDLAMMGIRSKAQQGTSTAHQFSANLERFAELAPATQLAIYENKLRLILQWTQWSRRDAYQTMYGFRRARLDSLKDDRIQIWRSEQEILKPIIMRSVGVDALKMHELELALQKSLYKEMRPASERVWYIRHLQLINTGHLVPNAQ